MTRSKGKPPARSRRVQWPSLRALEAWLWQTPEGVSVLDRVCGAWLRKRLEALAWWDKPSLREAVFTTEEGAAVIAEIVERCQVAAPVVVVLDMDAHSVDVFGPRGRVAALAIVREPGQSREEWEARVREQVSLRHREAIEEGRLLAQLPLTYHYPDGSEGPYVPKERVTEQTEKMLDLCAQYLHEREKTANNKEYFGW